MTTLLISGDAPPAFIGGVASWAEDLALGLVERGEPVFLLCRGGAADTEDWDAAQPFQVRRIPARSWNRWQAYWVEAWALSLLSRVDRVIAATWPLAVRLGPRLRRRGLPLAIAFHGSELTRLGQAPPELRRAAEGARLLPVSRFLSGELRRLGLPPGEVLPMPLRARPLAGEEAPDGPRQGLLCVARLTPLKGVDRAIRLAQALGEPLRIVGDGPEEGRLRAIAGPETTFLGRLNRHQVYAEMARARACLLLSRSEADGSGAEGLGLTLIEAMVQGCPAIASPVGGLPEAVGPGLVLAEPDAPDLAALRAFLADPTAGARGRAWALAAHGPAACLATLDLPRAPPPS